MRGDHRIRRLSADGTGWLWSVRHRQPDCPEVLSLHRAGEQVTLRIVFRAEPGWAIGDGYLPSGTAATGPHHLDLHEPGVVRRFLDVAMTRGLLPVGVVEIDRWGLFEAVVGVNGGWGGGACAEGRALCVAFRVVSARGSGVRFILAPAGTPLRAPGSRSAGSSSGAAGRCRG